jgi:hypothetical protein
MRLVVALSRSAPCLFSRITLQTRVARAGDARGTGGDAHGRDGGGGEYLEGAQAFRDVDVLLAGVISTSNSTRGSITRTAGDGDVDAVVASSSSSFGDSTGGV